MRCRFYFWHPMKGAMKLWLYELKKSGKLPVLLLTILCPLAGIYLIANKHPDLQKNPKVRIWAVIWFTVWFLGVAGAIYQPISPSTSIVNNQAATSIISEPEKKDTSADQDKSNQTQEASSAQQSTPDNAQPQLPTDSGVMSGIAIKEAENTPYDRKKYQPNWSVGSGCDIRSRILSSTSLVAVQFGSNGCTVKYGSWNDPYTGLALTGNPYQGDGTANDLDIDHVIPLKYVDSHGGYYWSDAQKRSYGASLAAMNNRVYLAVSASENRKKSDKGPSQYYPPNPTYRCEYSRKWRDIARTYAIALSLVDYNLIANVITSCGGN